MKRELHFYKEKGAWRTYHIRSMVGNDIFLQGAIDLPFNEEIRENSEEILKLIKMALVGDER